MLIGVSSCSLVTALINFFLGPAGALPSKAELLVDPEMDQELDKLWEHTNPHTNTHIYVNKPVQCTVWTWRYQFKISFLPLIVVFFSFVSCPYPFPFSPLHTSFPPQNRPDLGESWQQQQRQCGGSPEGGAEEGLPQEEHPPQEEDGGGERWLHRRDRLLWKLTSDLSSLWSSCFHVEAITHCGSTAHFSATIYHVNLCISSGFPFQDSFSLLHIIRLERPVKYLHSRSQSVSIPCGVPMLSNVCMRTYKMLQLLQVLNSHTVRPNAPLPSDNQ